MMSQNDIVAYKNPDESFNYFVLPNASLLHSALSTHRCFLSMESTYLAVPRTVTLNKPTLPSIYTHKLLGSRRNSRRIKAVASKWEPTKVVPQADRVLIRLQELPERSIGGVLLPKSAVKFDRYMMGEIVSVGSEVGRVQPGKKVLFSDINAYEVDLGTDTRHVFSKESDLLAEVD